MENNQSVSLLNNAPAHRSVFVKGFFAKNNETTAEHPPYSSDLTPTDFYLFPQLKSTFMGRRFRDVTDIIKNVKEELKMFFTKWLPETFPTPLQSLAEVYVAQVDHSEGSLNDCIVLCFFEVK